MRTPKLYLVVLLFALPFLAFAQAPIITLAHFDSDQDQLTSEEQTKLEEFTSTLRQELSIYRAYLIGHTDEQGSLAYNEALSLRRAKTVQDLLVGLGIPSEQVEIAYRAFLDPVDEGTDEEALARNRRVDIILEPWYGNISNDFTLIDPQISNTIDYSRSKTKITIPPDAFIDADGNPYRGNALITYREFRDYADFMMTDLPMSFNWEGEEAYFNSTGMFEIRAFDLDGNNLTVAKDNRIEVDFDQAGNLTGTKFWNFNEENNEWQSGDFAIDYQEGEMVKVKVNTRKEHLGVMVLEWPESSYWYGNKDTISRLQEAHGMLRQILASTESYANQYVPELDVNNFRQRGRGKLVRGLYAGINYIGHLSFSEAYDNSDHYNIQFDFSSENEFKIIDLSGKNPELEGLQGIVWKYNPSKFAKKYKDKKQWLNFAIGGEFLKNRFSDIWITRDKRNNYNLKLKYQDLLIDLAAQPLSSVTDKETINTGYQKYRSTLRAREKTFNGILKENLTKTLLVWPCIQMLLPRSVPDNEYLLEGMRIALLQSYIRELGLVSTSRREDYAIDHWSGAGTSISKGHRLESIRGYLFLRDAGRLFKSYLLGNNLSKEDWRERIKAFEPAVEGDIPIYDEVYHLFENPIPSLRLTGLGIFNLDVLKRFEEEKQILAQFKT